LLDNRGLLVHDEYLERVVEPLGPGGGFVLGLEVNDSADALDNHFLLEGLDDVIPDAELGNAHHILAAGLGREHDDGDGAEFGIGLEAGEHLDAVHDRHGEIEQDEVRALALGDGQSLDAVGRLDNFAGETPEGAGDNHADRLAVVHGEDFWSHKCLSQYWLSVIGLSKKSMNMRQPSAS
jgi:hypothetical protein